MPGDGGGGGGNSGGPGYKAPKFSYSDGLMEEAERLFANLLSPGRDDEDLIHMLEVGRTDDDVRARIKSHRRSMVRMPNGDHHLKFLAYQLDVERFYIDWLEATGRLR